MDGPLKYIHLLGLHHSAVAFCKVEDVDLYILYQLTHAYTGSFYGSDRWAYCPSLPENLQVGIEWTHRSLEQVVLEWLLVLENSQGWMVLLPIGMEFLPNCYLLGFHGPFSQGWLYPWV